MYVETKKRPKKKFKKSALTSQTRSWDYNQKGALLELLNNMYSVAAGKSER